MHLSRRRLLVTAAAVPAVLVADRGIRAVIDGARAAAGALRPPAFGTSATRCALCGATDHAMLDPRCPAAKPVL